MCPPTARTMCTAWAAQRAPAAPGAQSPSSRRCAHTVDRQAGRTLCLPCPAMPLHVDMLASLAWSFAASSCCRLVHRSRKLLLHFPSTWLSPATFSLPSPLLTAVRRGAVPKDRGADWAAHGGVPRGAGGGAAAAGARGRGAAHCHHAGKQRPGAGHATL